MKRRRKAKKPRRAAKRQLTSIPLPPARLANEQDNAVIAELANAPLGTLEVDRFVESVDPNGQSGRSAMADLRRTVIRIYVTAARNRAESRASNEKLKSAETALMLLRKAAAQLEVVKPQHARGLRGVLAIPADDPKGIDELTDFSGGCWTCRLEIAKIAADLNRVIRAEKAKPSAPGERKKRLRILTEALADWWIATTRKTTSPSVKSKPRDRAPSVVIGRSGPFLEFAKSILFEIDSFNPTEVESAVTNVSKQLGRRSE